MRQHSADVAPVRAAAEEKEFVVAGEGIDDCGLIDCHRIVRGRLPRADVRNAEDNGEKGPRSFLRRRVRVGEQNSVTREVIEVRTAIHPISEDAALERRE